MAVHALSGHFDYFFRRLNPSPSFERQAASEHASIIRLIENPSGPTGVLSPRCFLQGSYRQQTAIYTINDVDIIALCQLWQPGPEGGSRSWSRDEIFATIAAPLRSDGRYRDKVRYNDTSMCVKVDLGIKVEILPVVYKAGNNDFNTEPFRLYRPQRGQWEDGYARYHQRWLSYKNSTDKTGGNFIPAIKVLKHIRSEFGQKAVSFHIECLLHALPDELFRGSPANYITTVLQYIAVTPAETWYARGLKTPVGERTIFNAAEWGRESWLEFHKLVVLAARAAHLASTNPDRQQAIEAWQLILGKDFFPTQVGS